MSFTRRPITEISSLLHTSFPHATLLYEDEVASTQDILRRRLASCAEGDLCIAERQTHGRGRQGRHWDMPNGASLLCSIILQPPSVVTLLSLACGIAVLEACGAVGASSLHLKWPNDVVVPKEAGMAKLAGILVEGPFAAGAIVGMGVNVAATPPTLGAAAVSLHEIGATDVTPDTLVMELIPALARWHDAPPEVITTRWAELAYGIGERVRLTSPTGSFEGWQLGIDSDGALLVRTDSGSVERCLAGDVHMVSSPQSSVDMAQD